MTALDVKQVERAAGRVADWFCLPLLPGHGADPATRAERWGGLVVQLARLIGAAWAQQGEQERADLVMLRGWLEQV